MNVWTIAGRKKIKTSYKDTILDEIWMKYIGLDLFDSHK